MGGEGILVTGGAGFLGGHLVRALAPAHRVVVLDDLHRGMGPPGRWGKGVSLVRGTILDPGALDRALGGVDTVFHLAALTSVSESVAMPERYARVNVEGTAAVLKAAAQAGVRRVVFSSSAAVYGDVAEDPKREDIVPRPTSPYGANKVAAEAHCLGFHARGVVEAVVLRFFNIYGEGQDPRSGYAAAIPSFLGRMARGLPPIVHGDGRQTRDFIHVDDAVAALVRAAEAPGAAGQVLNIGTGRAAPILGVVECINQVLGTRLRPIHRPPRPGDVRRSTAAVERAREVLGFRPSVGLAQGIRRLVGSRSYQGRKWPRDA